MFTCQLFHSEHAATCLTQHPLPPVMVEIPGIYVFMDILKNCDLVISNHRHLLLRYYSIQWTWVSVARFLRNLSSLQGVSLYKCLPELTACAFLGSCLVLRDTEEEGADWILSNTHLMTQSIHVQEFNTLSMNLIWVKQLFWLKCQCYFWSVRNVIIFSFIMFVIFI